MDRPPPGPAALAPLDLFLAPLGAEAAVRAALLARDLRRAGFSVEVSADAKLKRALETANKLNARFALILGEDEIAAGAYTLKNMASGEQQTLPAAALPGALRPPR